MTDTADAPSGDDGAEEVAGVETVESIADEIRDEIRLGHVQDDVSHVLEERFDEAGISLRPEAVDDLAEDIEKDAST
ncbi:hypothetical protein [Pseudarthrobacter polychromogenes]|uniref:Uncharacterized protein n=1 Tax=Pseudarthrobacter polychromogenes TaxID=1676 RepID=A0ABQ1XYN2_9MICC|nr:hypothetical protein [Pseudarthrobacter polychromogenes]GGH06744.1 hypothetical protein GCM10011577_34020 [Pseudarthrobacter polychromogenes]